MSEPKRGMHNWDCLLCYPKCLCNTCQNDTTECCPEKGKCCVEECESYLADEPIKKGAQNV